MSPALQQFRVLLIEQRIRMMRSVNDETYGIAWRQRRIGLALADELSTGCDPRTVRELVDLMRQSVAQREQLEARSETLAEQCERMLTDLQRTYDA